MPLFNPLRRLSQYGAMAPVTPPFLPDDEDAGVGSMGSYSASAEPPDLETPGQPEPSEDYPRVNPLNAPMPSAASMGSRPGPSAREQYEQLQTPVAPKTSVKRQLAAAALSAIPFVNKTTLPQDVAQPGYRQKVAEFNAKQADLKRMTEQEDRQRKLDLEDLQKRSYSENIKSLQDARAENADTRKSGLISQTQREMRAEMGIPAQMVAGVPQLDPDKIGTYSLIQGADGSHWQVPTPEAAAKLKATAAQASWPTAMEAFGADGTKLLKINPNQKIDPAKLDRWDRMLTEYKNPNDAALAVRAANGDKQAKAALDLLAQNKKESKVVIQPPSLAPETVQMLGEYFRNTGNLPPMGMGQQGANMRAQVLNEAAKGGPANIGMNKADYGAQSKTLANLQKQADQVNAFEKTASKNLDVFLNTAKNVVDSGVIPANQVFRGAARMFGSGPQAKFDAARVTAFTEVSKVLSGSMAGVLSDSARREAESVLRGDYTLKQLMDVVALLKQDMANRKAGFNDQISEIRGRMGGGQQNTQGGDGKVRVKRKSDGQTGTIDPKDFDPSKYDRI